MRDVIKGIFERASSHASRESLKILKINDNTKKTTIVLALFLQLLNISIEYIFTNLLFLMIVNACCRFKKQYSFMRFVTHDIEKAFVEDLREHHIILINNAIHVIYNFVTFFINVRKALRSNEFLIILKMIKVVFFINLVFDLFEN